MHLIGTQTIEHVQHLAPAAATRCLVFQLADQSYALPLAEVSQIVPLAWLSRPPGLPSLLAGFLNLEGTAVAVLRLDRLFGQRELRPGLYTPLIVLRGTSPPVALLVERVVRIVEIGAAGVLPMPPDASFNDCAAGLLSLEGQSVVLLSSQRILSDKEQQCLAEYEAQERARLNELRACEP